MADYNPVNMGQVDVFDKQIFDLLTVPKIITEDVLLRSPIVSKVPVTPLDNGGVIATTIFTKRVYGDSRVPAAATDVEVDGFGQLKDTMIRITRYKDWGEEELAARTIGKSLMTGALQAAVGFWSSDYQNKIFAMVKSVFAGALLSTHRLDAKAYNMSWEVVEAATGKLGDQAPNLKVIIMHSKQLSSLKQSGMVKDRPASQLGYNIFVDGNLPSINGKPIIVTDKVPTSVVDGSTYYHAYVGAPGAIEFKVLFFDNKPYWTAKGAGTNHILQNSGIMARVPGVKFNIDSATDKSYIADADLANTACWTRIAEDDRDIPLVEIVTKADDILLS